VLVEHSLSSALAVGSRRRRSSCHESAVNIARVASAVTAHSGLRSLLAICLIAKHGTADPLGR
jgi:hypothetical protein